MNIKEYISSGIVEACVLGLAGEAERAEFEQLCLQYPELVAARNEFEESLRKNVFADAVTPPAHVKDRFLEAIQKNPSIQSPKIIAMKESIPVRRNGMLRFVAAASVLLLLGSIYFAYQFYTQNEQLKSSNAELQSRLNSSDSILNQIVAEQKIMKDSNVTIVNLVGTKTAPRSSANVYWDSTSSDVFLIVKNMPKLPSDKQYQLWALINGQPKDLGVFDVKDEKIILKMKNTQKADAFAITIEQKGGSPSPTLEKMQSLGKIIQSQ